MIKAVFLSNPNDVKPKYDHPWKRPGGMIFNSKEIDFEPENGLVLFMNNFTLAGKVEHAVLRATALGIFELYLNGERVGARGVDGECRYDELKPTWTDYRHRVFEYTYDITDSLKMTNTVIAEVSPGWYSGRISFGHYGFRPSAFCGEIEICYTDGRHELICDGWKTSMGGKVRRADIWDGEYFDAREPDSATEPEKFDWIDPVPADGVTAEIVEPVGEPIRVLRDCELKPRSAVVYRGTVDNGSDFGRINVIEKNIKPESGAIRLHSGDSIIFDFGQNMVGRPKISIRAERGTTVRGYFAEFLNDSGLKSRGNDGPCGSLYIMNYRSALARYTYVASGDQAHGEVFEPLHTFYGFRYFELCADSDILIHSVRGVVISSDIRETGSIETDNAEVNRLISNVKWGMRGNYLSVPTDCPQRDERLGWTGDTQVFAGAASYFCDIDSFMRKWLGDARHSQIGYDGAYCDVIPRVFDTNNGNAAWGDAGLIVPYRLWLMYGDTDTIAEHYDSMEYYMRYLEQYGLEGANTAYGDWLNYDVTDKRYIAVCYYAYDAELMAKFSEILGKSERAAYYRDLHERIVAHFAEKYIKDDELTQKTQTSYLLALRFGLLPEKMRRQAIDALRAKIVENDYTLSTGFIGTGILNQTLSEVGLDNLAYSLLLQTRDPSWLYSVRQGATTVWERWNSYTLESGFGNVGMNSFNHYAYGAVVEWMFSGMAGIRPDPDQPGFEKLIIAPRPDLRADDEIPAGQRRINHVKASFRLPSGGEVMSEWSRVGERIVYSFVVPECGAQIELIHGESTLTINGIEFGAEELGAVLSGGVISFRLDGGVYTVS